MMKIKNNRGTATIEFVIGFMAFWLICVAWVEISYISYISGISDLIISEAARKSKTEEEHYLNTFHQEIRNNQSLWGSIIDMNKFTMSVQYVENINNLSSLVSLCPVPNGDISAECGTSDNRAIAIYRIDYRFSSIFTYFLNTESIFSREVIVIQEYERDKFEI